MKKYLIVRQDGEVQDSNILEDDVSEVVSDILVEDANSKRIVGGFDGIYVFDQEEVEGDLMRGLEQNSMIPMDREWHNYRLDLCNI